MNVCKFNKKKKYFGIFKFEFIARIGGVDSTLIPLGRSEGVSCTASLGVSPDMVDEGLRVRRLARIFIRSCCSDMFLRRNDLKIILSWITFVQVFLAEPPGWWWWRRWCGCQLQTPPPPPVSECQCTDLYSPYSATQQQSTQTLVLFTPVRSEPGTVVLWSPSSVYYLNLVTVLTKLVCECVISPGSEADVVCTVLSPGACHCAALRN